MKSNPGKIPIEKYSIPVKIKKTKLSQIFYLLPRKTSENPGRSLSVLWNAKFPLVNDFENKYVYTNTFFKKGITAGNHFHNLKQELFVVISGDFLVTLEDIVSKEREEIKLQEKDNIIIYVPTRIAHSVTSVTGHAVLLVMASSPARENDELPYKLV